MLFFSISYCEISCYVLTKISNQNDTPVIQEKEVLLHPEEIIYKIDDNESLENKTSQLIPPERTEEHLKHHFSLITTIIEKNGAKEAIIIDEILQTAEDNVFRPLFLYRLIKKRENERRNRRQKLKLLKDGRVTRSEEEDYPFNWYPYLFAEKNSDYL